MATDGSKITSVNDRHDRFVVGGQLFHYFDSPIDEALSINSFLISTERFFVASSIACTRNDVLFVIAGYY